MSNFLKLTLAVILIGALVYVGTGNFNSNQASDNSTLESSVYENLTVKVIIPDQEAKTYPAYSISDLTLEQVLERIMVAGEFSFKTEKSSFGSYITTVNNVEADSTKQYWSIAINGQDAMQGISDINPVNGNIITLTLKDL